MRNGVLVILLIIFSNTYLKAESIEGQWKTIDDITGEVKSIVEITVKDGKAYGAIVQLFNEDPDYNPNCIACKGELKGQQIIGMQIINGLKHQDGRWVGRKGVMDPDNGKFYYCKLWLDPENPNKLIVRGYIAFFYRKQIWLREK